MRAARSSVAQRRPVATCAKGTALEVDVFDSTGTALADVDGESVGATSLVAVEIGAVEVTVMEEKPLLMGVSDVVDAMLSNDADADDAAGISVGDEDARESEVEVDST